MQTTKARYFKQDDTLRCGKRGCREIFGYSAGGSMGVARPGDEVVELTGEIHFSPFQTRDDAIVHKNWTRAYHQHGRDSGYRLTFPDFREKGIWSTSRANRHHGFGTFSMKLGAEILCAKCETHNII